MKPAAKTASGLVRFNAFLFVSTFARSLIEIFVALYFFKNGFQLQSIVLFYLLENIYAVFLTYIFVRLGEKLRYSIVLYIGVAAFIVFQLMLNSPVDSLWYIVLSSFLYTVYRRGYWTARRNYATNIMPSKNSSGQFSITMVVTELASIFAGLLGGLVLDNFDSLTMTILASALLVLSVVPLFGMERKHAKNKTKIQLCKNLKKFNKLNVLAFSVYEITHLLTFFFPVFIALYIGNTYSMTGSMSAISSISVFVLVLSYGQLIKKKNFFILSVLLFIAINCVKLVPIDYVFAVASFVCGIISRMFTQSTNKIYYESRNGMDPANYSLVYLFVESVARTIVSVPLLFIGDVRIMLIYVLAVMAVGLFLYMILRKGCKSIEKERYR